MEQARDIYDYIAILKRRHKQLWVPVLLVVPLAIILAFTLKPVYQSSATIMIEQPEIAQDLVRTTVSGYAEERIQVISRRVMTFENLSKVIEKLGLFTIGETTGTLDELVATLKSNVGLRTVSATVSDPTSGRSSKATIAFNLTFDHEEPEVARTVVDEIAALYLAENVKIRTQRAETASDFLTEESRRLGEQVSQLEAKLANFKERNMGRLPEQMQLNMGLLQRTERELENTVAQINSLEERKVFLDSQIAQVEPYKGDSPETRLRELQSEYTRASALYSPDHPDLVRMRREIEVLQSQTGSRGDIDQVLKELRQARRHLEDLKKQYSPEHPDVQRVQRQVDGLEMLSKTTPTASQNVYKPDNPAYINLMTQLDALKIKLRSENELAERLKVKLGELETRIMQIPRVEQEGLALERDYDNAVKKYREIRQKLLQAEVGEQLEKEQKGERFSLIEPATMPAKPIKPNRPAIIILGFVLSLMGGLSYASLAEFLDHSIRGVRGVKAVMTAAPLTVIPDVTPKKPRRRSA